MSGQRLHLFTAVEVAEELALRDAEMLRRITPEEISNGAWMENKNVGQGIYRFLYYAKVVSVLILRYDDFLQYL